MNRINGNHNSAFGGYSFYMPSGIVTGSGNMFLGQAVGVNTANLTFDHVIVMGNATSAGSTTGYRPIVESNNIYVGSTNNIYFTTNWNTTAERYQLSDGDLSLSGSLNSSQIQYAGVLLSSSIANVSATTVLASVNTSSYDSSFYDYVVQSGSNMRAGTVTGMWLNGTLNYTETAVNDIGDTSLVTMSMDIVSSDARLVIDVPTSNWVIKTAMKFI